MRKLGDHRTQETRNTLGDHANPPLVTTPSGAPKFELLRQELEVRDRVEDARARYGHRGDEDSWNSGYEYAATQAQIERDSLRGIIGLQIEMLAAALYSSRIALAVLKPADALALHDKLEALHFSAERTVEQCAKLLGKDSTDGD